MNLLRIFSLTSVSTSELYSFDIWNDNLQSFNREKMKHRYQSFTRIGRQFQSLERQVYADWTSVSFPFCQRSCLIWRIMTNTLTNAMTNTYVVFFCRFQFLVGGYHSRYQNFEFTGFNRDSSPIYSFASIESRKLHLNLQKKSPIRNDLLTVINVKCASYILRYCYTTRLKPSSYGLLVQFPANYVVKLV